VLNFYYIRSKKNIEMDLNQNYQTTDFTVIETSANYVSQFMAKVFGWMFLGLLVTAVTSLGVTLNPQIALAVWSSRMLLFGLIIVQFAIVGFLAVRIQKMSYATSVIAFLLYSAVTGVILSTIFAIYDMSIILKVFGITSVTFGIMAVLGYTTKTDLTKFGRLMMMGLIGVVIATIINFFMNSPMLHYIISYIGLAVFIGLTAYDTQKIKAYALIPDAEMRKKASISGALDLYLDFINMFLFILRIFGNRD
jgi:FtsH-binding integral membrane protein